MASKLDPHSFFNALKSLATGAGMPTEQIEGIACVGGYHSDVDTRRTVFAGFDLSSFITKASNALPADKIRTILKETQTDVPDDADHSFLSNILPTATSPIVQKLVDTSAITIQSIMLSEFTQTSFVADVAASITNVGPFDGKLSAPDGLVIAWSGSPIGTLKIPEVDIEGEIGGKINGKCVFEIADVKHITDFTKTLLTAESFDWSITGKNLKVNSLGVAVSGISLGEKKVTLKGFNSFKDAMATKSSDFKLPDGGPSSGISFAVVTTISNPSPLGVSLNRVGFQTYIEDAILGLRTSTSFVLPPNKSTDISFSGVVPPQTSDEALASLSRAAANLVNGKPNPLVYKGEFAGPESVTWLSDGFKALSIHPTFPDRPKLELVKSIEMDNVSVHIKNRTFSPLINSDNVRVAFEFPHSIPMDIIELKLHITAYLDGKEFAGVSCPMVPCTTDIEKGIVHLKIQETEAFVTAEHAFFKFLKDMITGSKEHFVYFGTVGIKAKTPLGVLTIEDISYSNLEVEVTGLTLPHIFEALAAFTLDILHIKHPVIPVSVRAKKHPPK